MDAKLIGKMERTLALARALDHLRSAAVHAHRGNPAVTHAAWMKCMNAWCAHMTILKAMT